MQMKGTITIGLATSLYTRARKIFFHMAEVSEKHVHTYLLVNQILFLEDLCSGLQCKIHLIPNGRLLQFSTSLTPSPSLSTKLQRWMNSNCTHSTRAITKKPLEKCCSGIHESESRAATKAS